MIAVYLVVVVAVICGTGFLVYRSQDFRKFLAGAFFVSAGIQGYLAWMGVSIPLAGTNAFQTPDVGWARASFHTVLFLILTYFGFIHRPKRASAERS